MTLHSDLAKGCNNSIAKAFELINYSTFRFSPEDKYSRQRITIKKRFNLLPTQGPAQEY